MCVCVCVCVCVSCAQNMEYKFVEMLSLSFVQCDEESVRQNITFRYNAIKSRLALAQARPRRLPQLPRHCGDSTRVTAARRRRGCRISTHWSRSKIRRSCCSYSAPRRDSRTAADIYAPAVVGPDIGPPPARPRPSPL